MKRRGTVTCYFKNVMYKNISYGNTLENSKIHFFFPIKGHRQNTFLIDLQCSLELKSLNKPLTTQGFKRGLARTEHSVLSTAVIAFLAVQSYGIWAIQLEDTS